MPSWIEKSLGLGILLLLVAPGAVMAYVSYSQAARSMDRLTLSRRDTVAYLAATNLEEKFDGLTALGTSFASRVQFRKLIVEGKWDEAVKLVASAPADFPDIDAVFLTQPDGLLTAITTPDQSVVGKNFNFRDWYTGVSKNWQPYVSEIYVRANEPQLKVIAVAVPIKGNPDKPETKDEVLGILTLQVKLDKLLEWSKMIDIGEGGFVYFVDKNGHVAGHPTYTNPTEMVDFSETVVVKKVLAGETGVEVLYNSVDNEERLVAYRPVSAYGWAIIAQQPTATAFMTKQATLRSMAISNGIIFLVNCLLAVAALAVLVRLRHSQKELSQSVQEKNQFFTLSLDMIATAGFDGYFKEVNPAWEKATGFSAAELTSKPYIEFVHPDDKAATIKEGEKLNSGATVISFENRYQCKDGTYKWLAWNATPVKSQKIIYAVARDITEVKHTTQMLKQRTEESEQLNELMIGREEKMVQLKQEIARLKQQLNSLSK